MDAETIEMLASFQEECFELLTMMEESLLKIQDNGVNTEDVGAMFRAMHTVKGGAGVFGLDELVKFTHIAENLLSEIRSNKIEITDDILNLFFEIKDHLTLLIQSVVQNNGQEIYGDELNNATLGYETALNNFLNAKNNVSEELSFEDEINKLIMLNERKREQVNKVEVKNETKELKTTNDNVLTETLQSEQKSTELKKQSQKDTLIENTKITQSSTLKVDSFKIDSLINLVGEIVIANANVAQHANRIKDRELSESVHVMSRMIEEIREASMQTRMVPIGETFSRFKRVVRDLSKDLNKDIDLQIVGGETELDKTVIEKIADPLIHLIRNSLDHGIESKDVRLAKGKDVKSVLKLKASHEAGSIVIQVIDDGKGLDSAAILKKAIEKTIIGEHDILTQKEIFNLIMMPGFSTAEQVSKLSGRGVGMDVVRKNVEELRGTIDLDSIIDVGTTITIRLPLTLAIIEGFMIRVSKQHYIIPLEMIVECIELTKDYKAEIANNSYINLRGNVLPLLDMRSFFRLEHIAGVGSRENIVIVRFGNSVVGLIVDELVGEFQTVIKPLGKVFRNAKGIGGSTILGNGQVSLILDIPMLLQYVNQLSEKHKSNEAALFF